MHYPVLSFSAARHHLGVAALCAAWGGAVALPLFVADSAAEMLRALTSSVLGAGFAGLICAPLFGRSGRIGWALALLGGVTCTWLGAGLGGMIHVSPAAGPLAALLISQAILETPLLALLWGCCLVAVQLGARWLRA